MPRARLLLAAASVGAILASAGCSSAQPEQAAPAPTVTVMVTPTVTPSAEAPIEAPVSDIEAAVDTFVTALDQLGIEHSEPTRKEVGASGAKAVFDITVNGYDAGINVFPDAKTLAAWGELSDAYGGIFVSSGNAALSLNSRDGIANSVELAPAIADAVNGQARGV